MCTLLFAVLVFAVGCVLRLVCGSVAVVRRLPLVVGWLLHIYCYDVWCSVLVAVVRCVLSVVRYVFVVVCRLLCCVLCVGCCMLFVV